MHKTIMNTKTKTKQIMKTKKMEKKNENTTNKRKQ